MPLLVRKYDGGADGGGQALAHAACCARLRGSRGLGALKPTARGVGFGGGSDAKAALQTVQNSIKHAILSMFMAAETRPSRPLPSGQACLEH
eukprot:1139574-Pelagomonas_calceolata.AAC.3